MAPIQYKYEDKLFDTPTKLEPVDYGPPKPSREAQITSILDSMGELLITKNKRYGDSALTPLGIFSKKNAEASICTRLDDKLSRIKNSNVIRKNDVSDIMGYLVLLCIDQEWFDFAELID